MTGTTIGTPTEDDEPALALILPATCPSRWADAVEERVHLSLRDLCRALGLATPALPVTRGGGTALLRAAGTRHEAPEGLGAAETARHLAAALAPFSWRALLAPALAAQGIPATWWLAHAARRGLTLRELAALAADGANDDTIAWRLADRHPPLLALRAGEQARAALVDEAVRHAAARDAAAWTGLPIPLPPQPGVDPSLGPGAAGFRIGALPLPDFAEREDVGWRPVLAFQLCGMAGALVDPALALALVTDEQRVRRRHAERALARAGAVAIARRIAEAADGLAGIVDLDALVDEEAGLSLP